MKLSPERSSTQLMPRVTDCAAAWRSLLSATTGSDGCCRGETGPDDQPHRDHPQGTALRDYLWNPPEGLIMPAEQIYAFQAGLATLSEAAGALAATAVGGEIVLHGFVSSGQVGG